MTEHRMTRLRAAVLKRIGAAGDMDILVSCRTVIELLDRAGVGAARIRAMREREDRFAEVPAFVLESLVMLSVAK